MSFDYRIIEADFKKHCRKIERLLVDFAADLTVMTACEKPGEQKTPGLSGQGAFCFL
jgi:hypothetical protein